ncbi:MAG: hypothetical protein JWR32_1523 [Mycobacterium sp.]|jgi:hypothetical protein|nr:hypothetical protein [Mycobacterium sp.]
MSPGGLHRIRANSPGSTRRIAGRSRRCATSSPHRRPYLPPGVCRRAADLEPLVLLRGRYLSPGQTLQRWTLGLNAARTGCVMFAAFRHVQSVSYVSTCALKGESERTEMKDIGEEKRRQIELVAVPVRRRDPTSQRRRSGLEKACTKGIERQAFRPLGCDFSRIASRLSCSSPNQAEDVCGRARHRNR